MKTRPALWKPKGKDVRGLVTMDAGTADEGLELKEALGGEVATYV